MKKTEKGIPDGSLTVVHRTPITVEPLNRTGLQRYQFTITLENRSTVTLDGVSCVNRAAAKGNARFQKMAEKGYCEGM
jgi:hypothetical protein